MNNTSSRWVTRFADRADAGRRLAARLRHLQGQHAVVLALPRGGVPVASEVARSLGAPLDVLVTRRLSLAGHRGLSVGAVGEGGYEYVDRGVVARRGVTESELCHAEDLARSALGRRVARLRRGRRPLDLAGRTVVVVDDGITTGSTARVACAMARELGAAWVVLAVPVAPPGTTHFDLGADELVCVSNPSPFSAVDLSYQDFTPATDEEVETLLADAARPASAVS